MQGELVMGQEEVTLMRQWKMQWEGLTEGVEASGCTIQSQKSSALLVMVKSLVRSEIAGCLINVAASQSWVGQIWTQSGLFFCVINVFVDMARFVFARIINFGHGHRQQNAFVRAHHK